MISFDPSEFVHKSLEYKLQNLQPIHFALLNHIYEHAKTHGCITPNNTFSKNLTQCYLATELLENLNIPNFDSRYFQMCINDLETAGLIINVCANPCKEWAFALTELGLQAIITKDK